MNFNASPPPSGRSPAAGRSVAAAALLAGLTLALGCTSEPPNGVGRVLDPDPVDVVLEPLLADQVQAYGPLAVEDPDVPLSARQVLYLGEQQGIASDILANFDFAGIFTEEFPESLFTAEHIKSVKLSLTMLKFYAAADTSDTAATALADKVVQMYYNIHQLAAPFDTTAYPGPVPAYDGTELSVDPAASYGSEPLIPLYESDFLAWVQSGGRVGILIKPDVRAEPGLVGFAARDLKNYGELQDVAVGTVVAPNFVVDFEDLDENFLLAPVADISTFHAVAPPPADVQAGFILRTGLRSYPALRFDFSALPANVFINRAILTVANDTTASFGPLQSIVVCELDTTLFAGGPGSLTLQELEDETFVVTGMTSVDPRNDPVLRFDVTQAVQRIVNGVYEGTRGLLLMGGEDFAPTYDQGTIDPDFYLAQFNFHGPAAADSLRPRIQVSYSRDDLLDGGAP